LTGWHTPIYWVPDARGHDIPVSPLDLERKEVISRMPAKKKKTTAKKATKKKK